MGGLSITQVKNRCVTTVTLERGKGVTVEEEHKGSKGSYFFRLQDLYERTNRIRSDVRLFTKGNSAFFAFAAFTGIGFMGVELDAQSAEYQETVVQLIFMAGAFLFSTFYPIYTYRKAKASAGDHYVFYNSASGQHAFVIAANLPSEEEATLFRDAVEEEVVAAQKTSPMDDEETRIAKEVENLAALRDGGVLSECEFSKAKALVLSR